MKIASWWNNQTFLQKFFVLFLLFSGVMWVLVPASYAVSLPFDPPETLMWGSTFNWGNAKHPPLSGWMLFHFCKLFGFQKFSVFLLSQICMLIGFIYIYKLARCFFDRDKSVIAALSIIFYTCYTAYIPKFNANIPHVMFLPMMYYYFYRGCFADKWHHWLLFAAAAAGACLSKYYAGIPCLILALFAFTDKDARKVLLSIKPYAAAVIFLILMVPHIVHLINTDFLTFTYIQSGGTPKFGYWGQLLMQAGAIILPMLCMSIPYFLIHLYENWRAPRLNLSLFNKRAMKYAGYIIGGQAIALIFMGLIGHRLEAKWTFPMFFTAGIFIMSFYPEKIKLESQRIFAVLCTIFTVIFLAGTFISHHCRTKKGYHLDMAKVRVIADRFHYEQTGKPVSFITGTLWESTMLLDAYKFKVKSAPSFDPVLMGLHLDLLNEKGGLAIAEKPEKIDTELEKYVDTKLRWHRHEIKFSSRFGKTKEFDFYLAIIPPGALKKNAAGK